MENGSVTALIFAGGVGSRMQGASVPKQFLQLGGKTIIEHTVEHFQKHPEVDGIVIVSVESGMERMRRIVDDAGFTKVEGIVPGGETGQESIYNGLREMDRLGLAGPRSVVLVHDGVRPLIDAGTIDRCIASVRERGSTATVAPSVETVIVEKDGKVQGVMDRSSCKLARAPQGFLAPDLLACHERAREEGIRDFIDSVSLMAHYGFPIYTVEGPVENIKITTQRDFFAFKGYIDYEEMSQLWDV